MPRQPDPDGKRITLALRVTTEKAAAIDDARGSLTRAAWLEQLVDDALSRKQEPDSGRSRKQEPVPRDGKCSHPTARRSKGLCMACGTYVG
jgi:hypothetical protein